jgi:hypothetical protein
MAALRKAADLSDDTLVRAARSRFEEARATAAAGGQVTLATHLSNTVGNIDQLVSHTIAPDVRVMAAHRVDYEALQIQRSCHRLHVSISVPRAL